MFLRGSELRIKDSRKDGRKTAHDQKTDGYRHYRLVIQLTDGGSNNHGQDGRYGPNDGRSDPRYAAHGFHCQGIKISKQKPKTKK